MASSYEKFKELDLTRDEVERIGSALKDKEFRKLLSDYVEEIHDPENRRLFQKEMVQLEKERGIDVTFINPEAGYVIKTSVNGNQKGFINICSNENIDKPVSMPSFADGSRGLKWTLPHSLTPPREDVDNKRVRCQVYDVVFHPDTLHLAQKNQAFRDMVNKTACEAIENNFDVKLDTKNLKFPKLQYKGYPHATVIRKESSEKPSEKSPEEQAILDKIYNSMPKSEPTKKPKKSSARKYDDNATKYTTPKYLIKHRTHIEMENFTYDRDAKLNTTIPKELIIEINLPLLKSSNDIVLDVTEKSIQLTSEKPAKYKLSLTLPYQVLHESGNAKFDKDKKKLIITLPVKRISPSIPIVDVNDSGVESDHGSVSTPPHEEPLIQELGSIEHVKDAFLDSSLNYTLPEYTCHLSKNVLAFTLHVKNVNEDTIEKLYNDVATSLHVKFTSISAGYFPVYYAFYVRLPEHFIDSEQTSIEAWDNNVVVQIAFKPCDKKLTKYLCGTCERHLEEKTAEDAGSSDVTEEEEEDDDMSEEFNQHEQIQVQVEDEKPSQPVIPVKPKQPKQVQKANIVMDTVALKEEPKEKSKAIDIISACSESSGDELSCSYSPKCKGILKRMSTSSRSSISRSVSECSSVDDITWASSHENFYNSLDSVIPEDGTEMSTSLKKTVRFNDHVLRQLFRSNSSILGQRKKNQRKSKNKKRAQERRHSESELNHSDHKKERDLKTINIKAQQKHEIKKEKDDNHIFEFDM